MTKRVGLGLVALLFIAFLTGVSASGASAVVGNESRVIVVDLPSKAERQVNAIILLNHVDGSVTGFRVKVTEGMASFLADDPADIVSISIKVGRRLLTPDNFMVTNIGVSPEGHGKTVGCPWAVDGDDYLMVAIDGSIVWRSGDVKTAPVVR